VRTPENGARRGLVTETSINIKAILGILTLFGGSVGKQLGKILAALDKITAGDFQLAAAAVNETVELVLEPGSVPHIPRGKKEFRVDKFVVTRVK